MWGLSWGLVDSTRSTHILEVYGDTEVVLARELTKKFEEIHRGTASELQTTEMKGEITLIIGPSP